MDDYEPLYPEESCHLPEVYPDQGTEAVLRVSGAKVPVSSIVKIWNSMARWIFAGPSSFASFLRTLTSQQPSADDGTAPPLWPIPVPYPRWMMRGPGGKVNYKRMVVEKAVKLDDRRIVLASLEQTSACPGLLRFGRPFFYKAVGRCEVLERLTQGLAGTGEFSPWDAPPPKWRAWQRF